VPLPIAIIQAGLLQSCPRPLPLTQGTLRASALAHSHHPSKAAPCFCSLSLYFFALYFFNQLSVLLYFASKIHHFFHHFCS